MAGSEGRAGVGVTSAAVLQPTVNAMRRRIKVGTRRTFLRLATAHRLSQANNRAASRVAQPGSMFQPDLKAELQVTSPARAL